MPTFDYVRKSLSKIALDPPGVRVVELGDFKAKIHEFGQDSESKPGLLVS